LIAERAPLSWNKDGSEALPWLCPTCYASFATAWWQRAASGFSAPAPNTVRGVLRRMEPDAKPLGFEHSSLWELCRGLSGLKAPPPWLDKKAWRGAKRFSKVVGDLVSRLAELRLPELLSRVFRALPRSRRYHGSPKAKAKAPRGLAEALKAEAELHLREAVAAPHKASTRGAFDESAKAQLQPFLERLDLGACGEDGPFSATAAGSGTAEVGRGRDAVTIATAHASKGRQWRNVLVIRFNDGVGFPLEAGQLQEEQRLAYVASSRACENLAVSYSLQLEDGRQAVRSRFLAEQLGVRLVEVEVVDQEALKQTVAKTFQRQGGTSEDWLDFLANPAKPGHGQVMNLKRRLFPRSANSAKRPRSAAAAGA